MRLPWSGRPTASLFARLLTLIGITLVASQVIILTMIFVLPPPAPDFYRLSEVAQTFKGRAPSLTERRPLELKIVDRAPSPTMEGRMVPNMRAELARELGWPRPGWCSPRRLACRSPTVGCSASSATAWPGTAASRRSTS
uniref:Uncharacterized protein n=1 Tax=Phenylobacterium glaciei TaxID=2803784 RepID=A0A974P1M6_9CAUL|nr:hypothetical protein JKL49_15040 [Phenylobacterium glaciei]